MTKRAEGTGTTRASIMMVARTLFDTEGYDATSVEQICDRLAIAENDFYQYFPSKEDLLEAVWITPPHEVQIALRQGTERRCGEGQGMLERPVTFYEMEEE